MNSEQVYNGSRGDDFTMMIVKLLKKGKLKRQYLNMLVSKESLKQYGYAFTAKSADKDNNYERFEQLGDVTANKFIVWYVYRRFPQLDCTEGVKVAARLRINYGAKAFFGKLGEELGFWPFITAQIEGTERNMYYRNRNKQDLLEDCLEAFIGCTEYLLDKAFRPGVGYAIVYDILENIFNSIDISLDYSKLYDAKTRLKETFDFFTNQIGTWTFIDKKFETENGYTNTLSRIYQIPSYLSPPNTRHNSEPKSGWVLLGEGSACKKGNAQQVAAENALLRLKQNGIFKEPPSEYKRFLNN